MHPLTSFRAPTPPPNPQVTSLGPTVACTITIHHLEIIIDDWAQNSHNYCKPVAKYPSDREALRGAVLSGMISLLLVAFPYIFYTCFPVYYMLSILYIYRGHNYYILPLLTSDLFNYTFSITLTLYTNHIGNPKFFLGSDSAPHHVSTKECLSPCAGVFTTPYLLCYTAHILESFGGLERIQDFACDFGRRYVCPCISCCILYSLVFSLNTFTHVFVCTL